VEEGLDVIRHLEELSMNAWPALRTLLYDGWVVRFANGYTKRANSVNPLYFSTGSVEEKITACEQLYRRENLGVVFKMTSAVCPEDLDESLTRCGYRVHAPTSVQTLELAGVDGCPASDSTLAEAPSEEWLRDLCRLNGIDGRHRVTLRQMLGHLVPQGGFISLRYGGQVVACGMGVVQDGFVGLFDIVTGAGFRNRGFGRQIVLDLLAWGKSRGARTAYLQVMLDNGPALRLYSKVGFREVYQYWYRVKP
jgi:ribosomal protein S18 acetylase RimI-like enzyme